MSKMSSTRRPGPDVGPKMIAPVYTPAPASMRRRQARIRARTEALQRQLIHAREHYRGVMSRRLGRPIGDDEIEVELSADGRLSQFNLREADRAVVH